MLIKAGDCVPDVDEKLVQLGVIAEKLGVSASTVLRYIRTSGLPAYRPGRGVYLFYLSEVEAWIKGAKCESSNTDSG